MNKQLPMTREEYVRADICTPCGGRCCKRMPGSALPGDFGTDEMLYFKERHKWQGMLGLLLHELAPDVYRVYEERGADAAYAAYNAVHPEDT